VRRPIERWCNAGQPADAFSPLGWTSGGNPTGTLLFIGAMSLAL
jgi:hypothetical protein